ncbi:MAG: TonB-dependent receptor domain-containing protein [Alphaproteobacteria bacterium]
MRLFNQLALGTASLALTAALAAPAYAQQITSEIRGVVTDPGGAALAGAEVVIVDTRTNATRRTRTDDFGRFTATNLVVGGPYRVTVSRDGFQSRAIPNVFLDLNAQRRLTFQLPALEAGVADEVLVVTGTRQEIQSVAIGPSSSFSLETLQDFPSISRDFRDIIRIDPRVSLERTGDDVDQISCIGGNSRFNTFTVDGVRQADPFGLNGTGFAGRNVIPLPFDSIREVSVEFAPFDVQYGQFTGCNINAVTKSGTNEFHGSAFAVFNSSGLTGSRLEDRDLDFAEFRDYNWGASLGGPIIKDKLFFYVAYEETDDSDVQPEGPLGGGFATEVPFLNVDTANEIAQITRDVYGIDPGGITSNLPEETRRILTRWDWIINDDHRLEFTYQRLRETNTEEEFINAENFHFGGTFEEEGTKAEFYSARLFSQWTDKLSTEIRISRADIQDNQNPVGGGEAQDNVPIPRLRVLVTNPDNGASGIVQAAGPGIFRSANSLITQTDQVRAIANYTQGRHTLTAGYELDQLDVFNLFIVNATGAISFTSVENFAAGIANNGGNTNPFSDAGDFEDGSVAGIIGAGSFSGDPVDAAANYSRAIHSLYLQDEWDVTDDLTLLFGIRYDRYESDVPTLNENFVERYGFGNDAAFDGLDAFLPRFGFTYDVPFTRFGSTQLRGGAGIFAGGDPTVWLSNAFQNFGGAIGEGSSAGAGCTEDVLQVIDEDGDFTGVPDCVTAQQIAQASENLGDSQSTAQDFELPTVIRGNFGLTHFTDFQGAAGGFFDDWTVQLDVIVSAFRNPADFVDLSLAVNPTQGLNGFTVDGRPIYEAVDPTADGCNAQFLGPRQGFSDVTPDCFSFRDDEIQLTNSDGFKSVTFSAFFTKEFEYTTPYLNTPATVDLAFGYAFTDADNRRDNTSAQSTSNFNGTAVFDYNNPGVSASNFETRHNVTMATTFENEFVRDYPTRVSFFFQARSGRPYSYTFDGGFFSGFEAGSDNALLYVPTGPNDPFISPMSDPDDLAALNAFIDADECLSSQRGRTFQRNSCRNDWFLDLDMRFQQSLPGFLQGHETIFFVDIDNLPNLISSEANIFRRFNQSEIDLVDGNVDEEGRYIIDGFNPDNSEFISFSASLWTVQIGLRYRF